MKKLLALLVTIVSFLSIASAQTATVNVGYQSKQLDFGQVSDARGDAIAGFDVNAYSFTVGAQTYTHVADKAQKFYRADFLAEYSFVSTLANLNIGTQYVTIRNPGKFAVSGHNRPFVSIGKDIFTLKAAYDTENKLTNVELSSSKTFKLVNDLGVKPSIFIGNTDDKNSLPHSVKAVSYSNLYEGGSLDLTWKGLSAGPLVVHDVHGKVNAVAWRAGYLLKF